MKRSQTRQLDLF